jgi:transketolase N-terminal domain/subunit
MKNINSMQQLRLERLKLNHRKLELEKAILEDWGHLKHHASAMETVTRLYNKFSTCDEKKEEETSTNGFTLAAIRCIKKWIRKDGTRLKSWFNTKKQ